MVRVSELYGKRVISSSGVMMGEVKGVIIDVSSASISHLLLNRIDDLVRSGNLRNDFMKNSISFDRVTKIGEGIVVKAASAKHGGGKE